MVEVFLVLAGGLIGGLSAGVVAFITNRSADNRLKLQLDYQNRQNESERLRAIHSEPINDLAEVIAVVSELTSRITVFDVGDSNLEPIHRVFGVTFKASISMEAIGEHELAEEIGSLGGVLTPFLANEEAEPRLQRVKEAPEKIGVLLESIARHRKRLMETAAKE